MDSLNSDIRGNASLEIRNTLFGRWARFVLRYRWPVLGLTVLATVGFTYAIINFLVVDNSTEAFLNADSKVGLVLEESRDLFGRDDVFLVVARGNVFTRAFLERLKSLHGELRLENSKLDLKTLGYRKKDSIRTRAREGERDSGGPAKAAKPEVTDPRDVDDGFGDFGDDFGETRIGPGSPAAPSSTR